MLRTVVVGLGRSGAGLHVPVLRRLRAEAGGDGPYAAAPMVGYDVAPRRVPDLVLARRLDELATLTDADRAVVHLCTPPDERLEVLDALVRLGFRRYVVEKPLLADDRRLAELERLRRTARLDVLVVGPWLASALTARLVALLATGGLGTLRAVDIVQRKPRIARSLAEAGPGTVFDIEAPHAVGLALRLSGPARLRAAGLTDLRCDTARIPGMGGCWLSLAHRSGVRTEIRCDLTAPVRQRTVRLTGTAGTAVGHFPVSADDPYAQLRLPDRSRAVFADDPLARFLRQAYRHFAGGPRLATLPIDTDVVRLLGEAKRRCAPTAVTR